MAVIDALGVPREDLSPSPGSDDDHRRRALAEFVRSRRERLTPLDVGLVPGARRRTPGLRREEVAQMASVGITWYTWLEQAREIKVSEQVLDAIARALQLDRQERDHLFTLAGAPSVAASTECQTLTPATLRVLEQVSPFPAMVLNGRYDILAYNRAYAGLIGDLDAVGVGERNNLWLLFTCAAMRTLFVDWEQSAARCVAQFRAAFAEHMAEPAWKCLAKRLAEESPEFAAVWARHDVAAVATATKRFLHPQLGVLRFESVPLLFRQHGEHRLVVHTPADDATAALVSQLQIVTPRRLEVRPR